MTFAQVALQDLPSRLWVLDGQAPFLDHSHSKVPVVVDTITNIVPNPSFETATTGWVGGSSALSQQPRGDGTFVGRATVTTTNTTPYIYQTAIPGFAGGKQYTLTLDVLVNAGPAFTGGVICNLRFQNAAGSEISRLVSVSTNESHGRRTISVSGIAPAGTEKAMVIAYWSTVTGLAPGDYIELDRVVVQEGASTIYFDGDSSGAWWNGAPGTSTSSRYVDMPVHPSLIKGASSAVLVGNTNKLNFDAPVMKRGEEDRAFTVEATFRPIRKSDSVAQQQIFGTASAMDGLVIAGTVLSFTTKYTNTGEARCEFDLQEYRGVTVAAVHTKKKNLLYVNGDMVAEIDISAEQQEDTYLAAGTSLSSGTSSGDNLIALNGLAVFNRALDEGDIDQHWEEATDNMDEYAVAAAHRAVVFSLNSSNSLPIVEYRYSNPSDWHSGRFNGTVEDLGQIVPQAVGDVSMAGTWETIVPLPDNETLSSITLNWQGQGATVETSTDGNSWSPERRAMRISTVNEGFQTSGKFLYLRVSFPGGITNDQSYFDDLVINMYGPTQPPEVETRTLTLANASIEGDFDITEYHEDWGIEINNGSVSLSGSTPTAMAPKTIQVWAKKSGSASFSDNIRAGANGWYTNDGTYQQEYQTDEWQLRTYVITAGHTSEITFSGTGQIGCVLLYDYELTLAQIKDTYQSFTGTRRTSFATSGTIGFVDLSSAVDIYEYDWSMESAG